MKQVAVVLTFVLIANSGTANLFGQTVPVPRMNVVVLEGEASINNIRKRQTNNIVVQVRDGSRRPVANATVVFTLPANGPGGTFPNGSTTLTVSSDQEGLATAKSFRPNAIPGRFEILVDASTDVESARTVVTQFNMSVEAKGGSGKWIAVLAVIGGAAAAGMAVTRKRNSNPAAAASAPIDINSGAGSVGPPR